jgi:hypothetical protein
MQKYYNIFLILMTSFALNAQVVPTAEYDKASDIPNSVYSKISNFNTILIGEVHGSNEGPQSALGIVNLLTKNGQKTLLCLPINSNEQAEIDKFMASGDMGILQKMAFFNNPKPDGKSSKAIAELLKSVSGNKKVKVACVDFNVNNSTEKSLQAATIAENIASSAAANSGYTVVSLVANIHSFLYLYRDASSNNIETMGYILQKSKGFDRKKMLSLQLLFKEGSAYNNSENKSGEHPLQNEIPDDVKSTGKPCGIFIIDKEKDKDESIYNGCFFIQKGTPSAPLNQ